jgi:CRISPR/Cas system-associated exonuclease Cas4 (RecB family)
MSSNPIKKQNSDEILCDAGRGQVTKAACLKCALAQENACGFDFALLNALYNDKEREGIHVTDLTGCLRQAYYNKTQAPLEYPHQMMARFLGTAVHKYIESYPHGSFDSELPLEGLGLVGTADIVYKDGRIVDFKTTRWLTLNKLPYGSHVQQLNIYAALLRTQGREVTSAAIQYVDMSGPSKCPTCKGPCAPGEDGVMICGRCGRTLANAHPGAALVEVQLDEPAMVTEWIQTRLKILEIALESNEVPDPEISYLCDYCPFAQECTKEQETSRD